MSRPKKAYSLDLDYKDLFELHAEEGYTILMACRKLGLNRATFYNRLDDSEELQKEYKKAHKLHLLWLHDTSLQKVISGKTGWQSDSWYRERKHPEEYALKKETIDYQDNTTITYK